MKKERRVYYYKEYTDDIVKSNNQNFQLSDKYIWVHNNIIYNIISNIFYWIMWILGLLYCKCILRVKIENRKVLKKYKDKGYFIFGNHTQEIGDVFIPTLVTGSKRAYFVVSPSNLGIKVLGKYLPMLGALPIPNKISKMKEFSNAVNKRIRDKKCVVIYPEAHIWPYYTEIRDFSKKSFKFPVNLNVPVFCMTTTYKKSKFINRPKIIVYIDGPFFINEDISKEEKVNKLHDEVYKCMKKRSINSNYEYIEYRREK